MVLLCGIQGAGKSELVESYLASGYERLNRDDLGGKLDDLVEKLDSMLGEGRQRVVLDNTYPTQVSRCPIIIVAHAHGVPVRCRHLKTSLKDAQVNVASRVLERYGKLLDPDERKELSKTDPNLPPPAALRQYTYIFEKPSPVSYTHLTLPTTPYV